jgi:N utilization substance protein A
MPELPNFMAAITLLSEEKNLPIEIVIETVEAALAAAYKRDYSERDQITRTELNRETSQIRIFISRAVVADGEVEDELLQLGLTDAKKIDPKAVVVEHDPDAEEAEEPYLVETEVEIPGDFGRVAAQTAKQVIIQRLREAEREIIFAEYSDKEGIVLNGNVQRVEGNLVYIDLGKALGILFASEQIPNERYYTGQRIKVYVLRVEQASRGPQIVLSRAHGGLVKHLFELEVPEIEAGTVEIKSIAREAGIRSKVAVESHAAGVDPVGTFVGGRGSRVQAVMQDLGEEKIDIIPYSDDPKTFISNALSPTKVSSVQLNEVDKKAIVRVPEDQLSLAIGKQGQNVRLAAKLTGWNIDIISADESHIEAAADAASTNGNDDEDALIQAVEGLSEAEATADAHAGVDILSGQEPNDSTESSKA